MICLLVVTACTGGVGNTIDESAGRGNIVQAWDERVDPYLNEQSVVPPLDSSLRRLDPHPD